MSRRMDRIWPLLVALIVGGMVSRVLPLAGCSHCVACSAVATSTDDDGSWLDASAPDDAAASVVRRACSTPCCAVLAAPTGTGDSDDDHDSDDPDSRSDGPATCSCLLSCCRAVDPPNTMLRLAALFERQAVVDRMVIEPEAVPSDRFVRALLRPPQV